MEPDPGPPYEGSEVHTSPENHDDSPPPRRPLIRLRPLRDVQTVTPEKRHSDDELPGGDEELARGHVNRRLKDADDTQTKTSPDDEDKDLAEAMKQSYDLHVQNLTGETMTRDSTASSSNGPANTAATAVKARQISEAYAALGLVTRQSGSGSS